MSFERPLLGRPGFPRIQAVDAAGLACVQHGQNQRGFFRGQSHRPAPISRSPTREKTRAVPNQISEMIQKESYFLCRSSCSLLPHRLQFLCRTNRLRSGVIPDILAPTILNHRVIDTNDRAAGFLQREIANRGDTRGSARNCCGASSGGIPRAMFSSVSISR